MFKKIIKGSKDVWCGSLEFDTTPKAGSYNPVTSDGVNEAIKEAVADIPSIEAAIPEGAGEEDQLVKSSELNAVDGRLENVESKIPSSASSTDKLVTKSELDNATASLESGYTPKGPASVSTLNGLTGRENGDQYIVTDSGTLIDGSLVVTDGESVAWDSTDEVWYKVNQYALKSVQDELVLSVSGLTEGLGELNREVFGTQTFHDYTFVGVSGKYYDESGSLVDNEDSNYCEIALDGGNAGKPIIVVVSSSTLSNDGRYIVLTDADGNKVESVSNGAVKNVFGGTYEFKTLPRLGWKILVSWRASLDAPAVKYLESWTESIRKELYKNVNLLTNGETLFYTYSMSGASTGKYYDSDGSEVTNASSSYKIIEFDSDVNGKSITVKASSGATSSDSRYFVLVDSNDIVKESLRTSTLVSVYGRSYTFTNKARTGWKLKCSWNTSAGLPDVKYESTHINSIAQNVAETYVKYVATDGSDYNDGSESSPLATISAAVELGAETVIVKGGVYIDNVIDVSTAFHDKITIKGVGGDRVIFKKSASLLVGSGAESLVDGYTNVYSVSCSSPGYSGGTQWLFFDGLSDSSQAIDSSDAHPLERGLFYRNGCTKIVKVSAANLSDALDEIEAATAYKWYYENGKLYFNRAAATNIYPIYRSYGSYFNTRKHQSVVLENLEFRYGVVDLTNLNMVEAYNVASKYVYGAGAFVYDNSISVLFDHCEASSCFMGDNGDGFNGHATRGTDLTAKYCTATLRECWSHDNRDDGYSDHEFAETCVDGGLFEFNSKGGITPSYGSHCVAKNVVCRYNRLNGFYYAGAGNDDGNGGQLICFGCVAKGNNSGGIGTVAGYKVNGANNRMVLVNCKSLSDRVALYCDADCVADVVDFGIVGADVALTAGAGTINKTKTSILE